ncbi:hypothetical protein SAMN02745121_00336 [Nannocystis exedens]|uniref:Uncharacterized protein n=1 Tax=Nannocystis exedens TaxID=54 RepID=A0A1I1T664_9BACT|nr:hypothetical protein [Nannocystis exedens]PCC66934.1 hypothetical protein NAEX_09532 [Nannocystis exedens]SFD50900.1 hypothetical protein SAMN02745121_00336 [Nannocystis exedens]
MWPLGFAGLFYLWNLRTSLRSAYEGARWRNSGGDPVLGHVLGNFLLLAIVTAVAFVRADALRVALPWWLLAATIGLTVGHFAAIAWLEDLGAVRRERSGA